MAEQRGTLAALATALAGLLQPLEERLGAGDIRALLAELGLQLPASVEAAEELRSAGAAATERLGGLGDLVADLEAAVEAEDVTRIVGLGAQLASAVLESLRDVERVADALKALGGTAGIPASELESFADALPGRLVDYLIVRNIEQIPGAAEGLELIGAVERTEMPEVDPQHPAFLLRSVDVDKLVDFVADPAAQLQALYAWGSGTFDGSALLTEAHRLVTRAGLPAVLDTSGALPVLDLLFVELRPRTDVDPPGLEIAITGEVGVDEAPFIRDDWQARVVADADLELGASVVLQPGEAVTWQPPDGEASGDVFVEWIGGGDDGEPYLVLGEPGASRVEVRQLVVRAGVGLAWDAAAGRGQGALDVAGEVRGGKVVISLAGADGFLGTLLGGFALESDFSLGVGFSTAEGFYFHGSATLEIQTPLHVSLGPVELTALTLSVGIADRTFPIGVALDLTGSLGPIKAAIEQVGVRADVSLPPERDGNAGLVDVALAFDPPKGVGLSLDVSVVKGGGFLRIDPDRGEYSGMLELAFADIVSVTAIGLITTRMPDGGQGFSLLVIITADFGTGIQLGFGFTLLAVGGLVGVNRTMRLEALMQGVRTGAVDSVMFPSDVVANAPKILSDLRTFFPPQEGTFLIAPMAKLGWGTPTMISLSLGIIIEVPGNIAILGVLRAALPADDAAVLVLQVNFAGAIEFDKQRIYFFAALFESRVLFAPIEGEMGLLMAYGDNPDFVASVGGFHPGFSPPPLPFPSPKRVSIELVNTAVTRVRVEGYLAVTSNTAQFGARVEVFFGLSACKVEGHVGFDALFQFSPFAFVISISASMSVKVFGAGLFSVDVRGTLEGPTPWRAHGKGSISVLFFSFSVNFDVTWGESRDTTLPPIEVMPLALAEFAKDECWQAKLPAGSSLLVSLRSMNAEEAGLILHPVGVLRVSQRRLPLELTLDKVGTQAPSDVDHVSLAVAGGGLQKLVDTTEQFAPAQFQDLDDADKLSRPAYNPQTSGLELSATGAQLRSSRMVKRIVRYEEIIIDSNYKRFTRRLTTFPGRLFQLFLRGASVARSDVSHARRVQYQPFAEHVAVRPETFTVAHQADNTAVADEAVGFTSEASAREYLRDRLAEDPQAGDALHVIPEFERVA